MAESLTLRNLWSDTFSNQPAVVIPEGGPRLSYAELTAQIERLATALRQGGIQPGDPVSMILPNGLEFLTTFLAATWARAVAAPLNAAYKVEEFRFYLEDAGVKAIIVPPGPHAARDAAAQLNLAVWEVTADPTGKVKLERVTGTATAKAPDVAPRPDDVALFLHTSGTTSRPKGVPLTHENLRTSIGNIAATYQLTPADVSFIVMPLFHVHGLLGATLSTLHTGGTVVIPPRFSAAAFWPQIKETKATWYSAVPTIHQILLSRAEADQAPRDILRFIRSCSAALAPTVFTQLEERFGAPVLEAYGMTEAAHQMASNPLPPRDRKPGTVGAGTGVEIAILDEQGKQLAPGERGEVCIRGKNVMKGYRNNPDANATSFTNGFFRTGDQGFLDANGYLTLTGRIKELINRGGEKIAPLEVDAVLLEHPAVSEGICFGVPDAKYGEEVHAAVVVKSDVKPEEIQKFCASRLADFKVPKKIYVATALPRTATGKIQRRHLAAHFTQAGG